MNSIQTLTSVVLSYNRLGDEGFQALGDALRENKVLRTLIGFANYFVCFIDIKLDSDEKMSNEH